PRLLEAKRSHALDQFRAERARSAFGNLDELLSDRRCAGNDSAVTQTGDEGARTCDPINSVVLVKALVLRGEQRIDDVRRHFFESQLVTETLGHARFPQRNSVAIQKRDALNGPTEKR